MQQQTTNYGNWVSMPFLRLLYSASALSVALFFISILWIKAEWLSVLLGTIAVGAIGITGYMHRCRHEFSFEGGMLMSRFHAFLADHLEWDGQGHLLDIGCGAGALSICCAKRFQEARVTGMDYWGFGWGYNKEQCERNAALEGVAQRTVFEKGDAAEMHYADETFDAAVSNFVFHEVRSQPDKRLVVKEALRVVKKGGSFAFQDLFGWQKLYGNMDSLINELKAEGIAEIHYIAYVERLGFVPKYLRAPWMMARIGLLYGKK